MTFAAAALPLVPRADEGPTGAALRLERAKDRIVAALPGATCLVAGRYLVTTAPAGALREACAGQGLPTAVAWVDSSPDDADLAARLAACAARALDGDGVAPAMDVLAEVAAHAPDAVAVKVFSVPPPEPPPTAPAYDPALVRPGDHLVLTDVHGFNGGLSVPVGGAAHLLVEGVAAQVARHLPALRARFDLDLARRLHEVVHARQRALRAYLAEATGVVERLGGRVFAWQGDGLLCRVPTDPAPLAWAMQQPDSGHLSSVASIRVDDVPRREWLNALDVAQAVVKLGAGGPLHWGVRHELPDPVPRAQARYLAARLAHDPALRARHHLDAPWARPWWDRAVPG